MSFEQRGIDFGSCAAFLLVLVLVVLILILDYEEEKEDEDDQYRKRPRELFLSAARLVCYKEAESNQ
ncbi:MAG TPA: hypothetical protein VGI88_05195 [Verrucomicrobiae bacterium]